MAWFAQINVKYRYRLRRVFGISLNIAGRRATWTKYGEMSACMFLELELRSILFGVTWCSGGTLDIIWCHNMLWQYLDTSWCQDMLWHLHWILFVVTWCSGSYTGYDLVSKHALALHWILFGVTWWACITLNTIWCQECSGITLVLHCIPFSFTRYSCVRLYHEKCSCVNVKYRIVSLGQLALLTGKYQDRSCVALSFEIVIACSSGMAVKRTRLFRARRCGQRTLPTLADKGIEN